MVVTVVMVKEPGAPQAKERRFSFEDEDAAWKCYASAVAAGFEARAEKVRLRDRVAISSETR